MSRNPAFSPCPYMRAALVRLAEGLPLGPLGWLARQHLKRCPQCTEAHRLLLMVRDELRCAGKASVGEALLDAADWREIESRCGESRPPGGHSEL